MKIKIFSIFLLIIFLTGCSRPSNSSINDSTEIDDFGNSHYLINLEYGINKEQVQTLGFSLVQENLINGNFNQLPFNLTNTSLVNIEGVIVFAGWNIPVISDDQPLYSTLNESLTVTKVEETFYTPDIYLEKESDDKYYIYSLPLNLVNYIPKNSNAINGYYQFPDEAHPVSQELKGIGYLSESGKINNKKVSEIIKDKNDLAAVGKTNNDNIIYLLKLDEPFKKVIYKDGDDNTVLDTGANYNCFIEDTSIKPTVLEKDENGIVDVSSLSSGYYILNNNYVFEIK